MDCLNFAAAEARESQRSRRAVEATAGPMPVIVGWMTGSRRTRERRRRGLLRARRVLRVCVSG